MFYKWKSKNQFYSINMSFVVLKYKSKNPIGHINFANNF